MSNFKQQLFYEFASKGVVASVEAFKARYQQKKESRFNVDGITYEIGPARLHKEGIEFEISSKMPQEELADRGDFESYFEAIKGVLADDDKLPEDIGMDNIVQDVGGEETKERDYVRLLYRYRYDDLYSNESIGAEIARLQADPAARQLPEIPNVNTLAGRVLLLCVEDSVQRESTKRMTRLIEANQAVRRGFAGKA
ncbi:hypothetical protein NKDENANG_00984 [Candidatus Entotheonellaceae bacterium PAL068K]